MEFLPVWHFKLPTAPNLQACSQETQSSSSSLLWLWPSIRTKTMHSIYQHNVSKMIHRHLDQKSVCCQAKLNQTGFHIWIKLRLPSTLLLLHFIHALPLECQFYTTIYNFINLKYMPLLTFIFKIPLVHSKHQVWYMNRSSNLE